MATRFLVVLGVLALLAGGCVSQDKYNALKLDRDQLAEQFGVAQKDAQAARAELEAYKQQMAALLANAGSAQDMIANQAAQLAAKTGELARLQAEYDALRKTPPVMLGTGPVDIATSGELEQLARQYPDLLEYDAARGMLKFKGDVTFAVGSAELTPRAKEVIGRFARIINSGAASGYDLLVVGHTDDQRVVNPATIAKGHKDNWYLSAHRAIAVAGEMFAQQVSQKRVGVMGYADQRPAVAGTSESARQQNRRVEVMLVKSSFGPARVATGSTPAPVTPVRQPKPVNKDTTSGVDRTPIINK